MDNLQIYFDSEWQDRVETHIRALIQLLGDNPLREGLLDTPKRVANMYREVFEGMKYTNDHIAEKFNTCFEDVESGDLVVVQDIPIFSFCEHHLALMYDMKVAVGYIPNGKVIGLSKIARIADMVSKRLQLQEKIGSDIYEVLSKVLNTQNIIVVIEGKHSCMTARGIKKDSLTKTAAVHGLFMDKPELRAEFYSLIKK